MARICAVPAATQGELKPIVADPVYNVPPVCTNDTVKLVEPPAERLGLEMPMMPG